MSISSNGEIEGILSKKTGAHATVASYAHLQKTFDGQFSLSLCHAAG